MWSNEERARLTQPDLGHGALGLHSLLLDYGDRAAHVVLCFAGKGLVGTPLLGGLNLFVASCISGLVFECVSRLVDSILSLCLVRPYYWYFA